MTVGDVHAGSAPRLSYGVDIGGTKVLGVAVDATGSIVAEARVATPVTAPYGADSQRTEPRRDEPRAASSTPVGREPIDFRRPGSQLPGPAGSDPRPRTAGDEVADAVAEVVRRLAEDAAGGQLGGSTVGVGVPGMLDRLGVLRYSPNLPGALGIDVGALVVERLRAGPTVAGSSPAGGPSGGGPRVEPVAAGPSGAGAVVRVENDANCAALAELRLGAARGARHALVVTLGTGIGGALVTDGRVQVGAHGFAGEIGHMVVDPAGPPCPCGGRGCWERYASGGGLGRLAREAAFAGRLHEVVALAGGDPELVRGEHVAEAARAGDPGALAVIEDLGWWVALGLSNLVAVVDPERIVLGGGLVEVGDMLLAPTVRAFAGLVEGGDERPAVPIVAATLGERSGAVGAALLARGEPSRRAPSR